MDSDCEDLSLVTPPNVTEKARSLTTNLLPEKSKDKYNKRYDLFIEWCKENGVGSISEVTMLEYLTQQAKICSPNYLCSIYSMLKATILMRQNIDISVYTKVSAFLKKKNEGYKPKPKSKIFTKEEVNYFLLNAPDEQYLWKKVALIFGICGGCRTDELCSITINDVEDKDSILIVNVPDSNTNKGRIFTVINGRHQDVDYVYYCKKFLNMRPKSKPWSPRLFLNYRNGRFCNQAVGRNTLGKIPMNIAQYLKLPNPKLYTGHALRRISDRPTLQVNAGETMIQRKRHDGWKITTVAKGDNKESIGKVNVKEEPTSSTSLSGNGGPNPPDSDCTEAKQRVREFCLKDRNLKPEDILAVVASEASTIIREYLNQNKSSLIRYIHELRSSHLEDRTSVLKRALLHDREERFTIKEETDYEDNGNTNASMEFETEEKHEDIASEGEHTVMVQPILHEAEGPFETIICGTSDVQIKQEIFEDESDALVNPMEERTSWEDEEMENQPNITSNENQTRLKRSKENPKTRKFLQHSTKITKAAPSPGMQKCQVCKEAFSSPSDLVEHCILHHSDASSKFLPASDPEFKEIRDPEIPRPVDATIPGSNATSIPLCNATSTAGFTSATYIPEYNATTHVTHPTHVCVVTTSEPNADAKSNDTTPPNPPGPYWVPPYISACEVFDGIFVSLRTVPAESRKATRDKILELVSFISKDNVDPSTISFLMTKK